MKVIKSHPKTSTHTKDMYVYKEYNIIVIREKE